MKRTRSWGLGQYARGTFVLVALLAIGCTLQYRFGLEHAGAASSELQDIIPNNRPERNPGGKAATFSTQSAVNLTGEYFQAQGTNGRSCASMV